MDAARMSLNDPGLHPDDPKTLMRNTMDQAARAFELKAPAVIVIGEVVSQGYLRELRASMSA
jgi:siroheme synthase